MTEESSLVMSSAVCCVGFESKGSETVEKADSGTCWMDPPLLPWATLLVSSTIFLKDVRGASCSAEVPPWNVWYFFEDFWKPE